MADLLESVSAKASAIAELAKRMGNPELMLKISDLKMQLAELKTACAALQDENLQLKSKNRELQAVKDEKTVLRNNVLYDEDGNGPYCVACYDSKDKKKCRLVDNTFEPGEFGNKKCPVCKTIYKTK